MGGVHHKWKPIEDLPADWESLRRPNLHALAEVWKEYSQKMKDSPALKEFLVKLKRQWAIETGQIERLYDLDRGVTKTLIEQGLHASLIPSSASEKSPEYVANLLNDQHEIVDGLFQGVTGERPITTSYIKQLHQVLMKHQDTTKAYDSLGREMEVKVLKGEWKKHPNSPTRADGTVHEYCPPDHVASEMDRLVAMHHKHCEMGVPPEIEAAWLHHRFVQIHPFQDGNGRMARILSTVILLRAQWLPLIVMRDQWKRYIDALEFADSGSLEDLVAFFCKEIQDGLLRACGVSDEIEMPDKSVDELIQEIQRQNETQKTTILSDAVIKAADEVCNSVFQAFSRLSKKISSETGVDVKVTRTKIGEMNPKEMDLGTYVDVSHLESVAKDFNLSIGLAKYGLWISCCIYDLLPIEITFSLYGVGRSDLGLLVGAFYLTSQDRRQAVIVSRTPVILNEEALIITKDFMTFNRDVVSKWIDESIKNGMNYWMRHR